MLNFERKVLITNQLLQFKIVSHEYLLKLDVFT